MDASTLNALLLDVLQEMERDAHPEADGYPVGLRWYCRHVRRRDGLAKDPRNHEVQWTRELTSRLVARGYSAEAETRYPNSADRCDVVIHHTPQVHHWVEVKGCWPGELDADQRCWNPSMRKHLAASGHDVDKLLSLPADVARLLSFVLIAFDDEEFELAGQEMHPIRSRMASHPWAEQYCEWWSSGSLRYRTRIWAWTHVRS